MRRRVNTALALVLAASMVAGPQVLAAEDGISVNEVSEDEVQSGNLKSSSWTFDFVEKAFKESECIGTKRMKPGEFTFVIRVENVEDYIRAFSMSEVYLNGKEYHSARCVRLGSYNNIVGINMYESALRGGKNTLELKLLDYRVSYETERERYLKDEAEIDYTTGNVLLRFDCSEDEKEQYVKSIVLAGVNADGRFVPIFNIRCVNDCLVINKSDMFLKDHEYDVFVHTGIGIKDTFKFNYDFYGTLLSKSSYSYEYDEDGNCVITLTPMCYSELAERSDDIIVKINDEDTEAEPILNDDDKTISFKVSKDFINDKTNDADLCLGEDSLYFEIEPEEKPSVIKLVHAWGRDIALDQDGNRVSGFVEVSGNKYYANKKGEVYKNKTILIDGKYYGFDANGVIRSAGFVNGWDKLYYYDENGVRITDELFEVNGKKYYADAKGVIAVNRIIEIDGVQYYFGKDGAMVEK